MERKSLTMQRTITFPSEGTACAGTLFVPDLVPEYPKAPGIIMGHGFASTKEMIPHASIQALVEAGFVVLTIDSRFLGHSEGLPRQQVFPPCQREDLRNALTWLSEQTEVNPERLGLWGTSQGGGNVLHVAAFDRRVKAVVAQVPAVSPFRMFQSLPPEIRGMLVAAFLADRTQRYHTGRGGIVPITAPEGVFSALGPVGYEWHMQAEQTVPTFHNTVTIASLEQIVESDPMAFIHAITPTPLLMIIATADTTVPPELQRAAFAQAGEPKRLFTYEGDHYDIYDLPETTLLAASEARAWFTTYLKN